MKNWSELADDAAIKKTIDSLLVNGINAQVVENAQEAKEKVFSLIPKGSEVMNMTSETIDKIGVSEEIQKGENYKSVKNILYGKDSELDPVEAHKLGGGAEYTLGSVHAVSEDGKIVVASNTGSQLGAYAYGSLHVIFVVGVQKIVKDLDSAFRRINEYVLPLESERARIAYGAEGSNVSKLLIINKEVNPERINVIFVKEKLGF